jgi:hypothetical protein
MEPRGRTSLETCIRSRGGLLAYLRTTVLRM